MILVAGGQLDPNIGTLLRRMLKRRVLFRDLLVGPQLRPQVSIDVAKGSLRLNGEHIVARGCFVRHDVFLSQKSQNAADEKAALNWFYAIRGWALASPEVRLLNRHSYLSENNKIENLRLARHAGLDPPETFVTNEISDDPADVGIWVQKPVAGGDYTTSLEDFVTKSGSDELRHYPRFVQRRMARPELRIYRIGPVLLGFRIASPDLDYRVSHNATIEAANIPPSVSKSLIRLCDTLKLDFAAADFMEDERGRLRFLEVNSQPMFAAFDRVVEGKLCDSMIDFLLDDSQADATSPSP